MRKTDNSPEEKNDPVTVFFALTIILFILLIFVLYIGDWNGVLTIIFAWFLVLVCSLYERRSRRDPAKSYKGYGLAALINAELKNAEDPPKQLRKSIEGMLERGKVSQDEISRILRIFSKREDEIGEMAKVLLIELQ